MIFEMIYKGYEFLERDGCLVIKGVKDFNPTHIFDCGQCFRWKKQTDGVYFGIVKDKCVEVSFRAKTGSDSEGDIIISNSGLDDAGFWYNYFDLGTDYSQIKSILKKDSILAKAIEYGPGIRILKQDFNEMLISFIISANNSIPRIMKTIENICTKYGNELTYKGKVYFTFPSINVLAKLTPEDLKFSSAGFRCDYIVHTAKLAEECQFSEDELMKLSYAQAIEVIRKFRGVGPKVADCVMLFSGIKAEAFPVDVWVKRVMEKLYLKKAASFKEITMFADVKFGLLAGYAQQYLFYYARENKIGIKKKRKREQIFKSSFCEVYFDKKLDAVICIWKNICKQKNYREPLEHGLNILHKRRNSNWIIDTNNGFMNEEDDNRWLMEEFIPKAIVSSCKHIFFIIDKKSKLRNEIFQQGLMLSKYFTVSYCDNMERVSDEINTVYERKMSNIEKD